MIFLDLAAVYGWRDDYASCKIKPNTGKCPFRLQLDPNTPSRLKYQCISTKENKQNKISLYFRYYAIYGTTPYRVAFIRVFLFTETVDFVDSEFAFDFGSRIPKTLWVAQNFRVAKNRKHLWVVFKVCSKIFRFSSRFIPNFIPN